MRKCNWGPGAAGSARAGSGTRSSCGWLRCRAAGRTSPSCARNLALGAAHKIRGTIFGSANQAPAKCAVGESIVPSSRNDGLVSPVFDIIGTVLGSVRPSRKVTVRTICSSRLVLSPGRKTHSSEKLPFHPRAGQNSWVSLPCMPAANDFQGPAGKGVTAPILKAGVAWTSGRATGRLLGERGRKDQLSVQARPRLESELTSGGRLSRMLDAVGRMAAEWA